MERGGGTNQPPFCSELSSIRLPQRGQTESPFRTGKGLQRRNDKQDFFTNYTNTLISKEHQKSSQKILFGMTQLLTRLLTLKEVVEILERKEN